MDSDMKDNVVCPGDPGFVYYDDEERELIESIENGEWVPVVDQEAALADAVARARRTRADLGLSTHPAHRP